MVKKKSDKDDPSGLFIPGGLLIGIGVGFITGNIPAGTLIGLGAGFVIMAISKTKR